jgi:hypothetical protein
VITTFGGEGMVAVLDKRDIGFRDRRVKGREKYVKQITFIPPDVLEDYEAAARALDYEPNDFIRAALRWFRDYGYLQTARGSVRLAGAARSDEQGARSPSAVPDAPDQ